ncbi:MAG TPA: DUF6340 family protein [Cytophagaceae bacterium]|nr:DUF6340 family protein [Cytophagaceae bacterium]
MKKIKLLLILSSILYLSSCTSSLRLNVLQPATIYVPAEIKTIALVNRTKPMSKAANVIEGVLSGEGLFQDKSGVDKALGGLFAELKDSPRFKIVVTNLYIKGSGNGAVFPPPMDWQEVADICQQYGADGICTIETYDSDTRIVPTRTVTRKTGTDGKPYDYIEFTATQTVTVQLGFRLYNPAAKTIVDQYHFTEQQNWTSRGTTEAMAIGGLINKNAASDQVSNAAGVKYAFRIAPEWIWVTRTFYSKGGHSDMKKAGRLAKVNNWQEARKVWMGLLGVERKIAGKAAYNIAVSYEYEGDLEKAKYWASKAYTEFGNKSARNYVNILQNRINDVNRLNQQMQGVGN